MDETDLALLREEIDSIDMEIVSLLESRLLISAEIGKFKKNNKYLNNWLRVYGHLDCFSCRE